VNFVPDVFTKPVTDVGVDVGAVVVDVGAAPPVEAPGRHW
jgi:hypothetical protein